jgi:hypothetical protein
MQFTRPIRSLRWNRLSRTHLPIHHGNGNLRHGYSSIPLRNKIISASTRHICIAALSVGVTVAVTMCTVVQCADGGTSAEDVAGMDTRKNIENISVNHSNNPPPAASPSVPPEQFVSGKPRSDPSRPGITLLVASDVDSLVWKRNQPNEISQLPTELIHFLPTNTNTPVAPYSPYAVLLSVYDPTCSACATAKPVIDALAGALRDEGSIRLMTYDASANNKHGFLTEDELKELPLIKLFPALEPSDTAGGESLGARESLTYTGAPNARSIVEWISEHTPTHSAINVPAVQSRLNASAASTDASLRLAASDRLAKDPVFHVYQGSPCGPQMMEWMKMTLVSRYLHTPIPDDEQQNAFNQFQLCMQQKDKQMKRYWQQLAMVAADNLSKYEEKSKRQQQAMAQATPIE